MRWTRWKTTLIWRVELDDHAREDLAGLDKPTARRIIAFLRERVVRDPRAIGQALKGSKLGEFWKYRVGDYRIIASIEDGRLVVLVVKIGNRREVCRR
jgi:mRNA interferase RelE/StbE